jgi:Zn-dependent peptidase ImmA (M78 family)
MELDLWFANVGGMEGMYWRQQRKILVASRRPPGRQSFTAAHEIGHDVFGHGTRIDELLAGSRQARNPKEMLADCFAGFLLMPKATVCRGFNVRDWRFDDSAPEHFYVVAQWLGVGYEALVTHMSRSIRLLTATRARALLKVPPRAIRMAIEPRAESVDLFVVDDAWTGRAVDMRIGDLMLLPRGAALEGNCTKVVDEVAKGLLARATNAGHGRCLIPDKGWAAFVRVSRREFAGRGVFRHLEEAGCAGDS